MRFGQNALQNCNVIVKDVRDSKKNDTVIHRQKSKTSNKQFTMDQMNCLAVSKGYWPINYDNTTTFQLPQNMKQVFNQYSQSFSKLKAMRKIHYHNNLGHVNLTLSFKNGNFDFKCLPIHAVIINYFDQDKLKDTVNGISSQQLSNNLHITPNIIKQKMSFWVHKGVIREIRQPKVGLSLKRLNSIVQEVENVFYKPVEEYVVAPRDEMDDDFDEFISKQNTSMQSHLKHIIEGLIISILNINGPKSPQKIHLLLKTVYKTDLDYAYGQAQTLQILKKMFQKKKIAFNGELYSKISK